MPKLTAKLIEQQPRPERRKQVILRDTELKGFGVRLTPTTISYVCETRVNGKPKRVKIGRYSELTPEEARKQARIVLGKMTSGKNPGRPRIAVPTLEQVLEKFFATRTLRPSSVIHYRSALQRCVRDWLGLRIDRITKEMVLQRHKDLTKPSRQGTDSRAQANKALEIVRVILNFAMDKSFLRGLLQCEYDHRKGSPWVFQSTRLTSQHLSESAYVAKQVRAKCGVHFTFHDLRRTFLTMGEKLDVTTYVLKRLVNHNVANDITGRYIICDIERLRFHIERINDAFVELMEANVEELTEWKRIEAADFAEVSQMQLPIHNK